MAKTIAVVKVMRSTKEMCVSNGIISVPYSMEQNEQNQNLS